MINKNILLVEHTTSEFLISRLGLAQFLINRGIAVSALLPKENDAQLQTKNIDFPCFRYPYNRNNGEFITNFRIIAYFSKIISQKDFDIIHSFKFQPNFYVIFSNLFSNKKILLHITGLGIVFSKKGNKYFLLKFVSQTIFLLNFIRANKIIFQNPDDINDLWFKKLWQHKSRLVKGSGVDTYKFDKGMFNRREIRARNNIDENAIVLSFVSRLVWEKGIKELLESFKIIREKYPTKNLVLLIIGNLDNNNPNSLSENDISKHSDSNVLFLGRRNDINELLAISDIYVYPSYYREGIPRSILEALATGLPIITTNMPGCNLTVDNNKNGFLIKPKDIQELTSAIEYMLLNTHKWQEMGLQSRLLAINEFRDEKIFEQILKIYQEIL